MVQPHRPLNLRTRMEKNELKTLLILPQRPRRLIAVEKTRPPRFLDDPCVHAPLSDPGGPPIPGHFRPDVVVFRLRNEVASAATSLEAPSRGLHALWVRFAAGVAPGHATLDSGWRPAFIGQGSRLLGRVEGFRHVYPPTWFPSSPGFTWRNTYKPHRDPAGLPRSRSFLERGHRCPRPVLVAPHSRASRGLEAGSPRTEASLPPRKATRRG